jgi:cytochrome c-type biogenesis protein CcsB
LKTESYFFYAGLFMIIVSIVMSIADIVRTNGLAKQTSKKDEKESKSGPLSLLEKWVLGLITVSFLFISIFLILRTIRTGHGPFTSMYEFAIAFVWGILLMGILFSWKYRNIIINLPALIISILLMIYASNLSAVASPLVPALQNSVLLSAHVFSAVIAYGAFTIGFITSIFYIIPRKNRFSLLPDLDALENISYHSVIIGFPFMTLVIILGALWADIAWGRYWGWDPKETASLVTWLIYAGYLHSRVIRGWRGRKTALLLIIGFIAVVLTFFGNYIFDGLHAYG